jgi:hypothetical protein
MANSTNTNNNNTLTQTNSNSPNGKSRGSSIAIDPLQPDPLINNAQFIDLFQGDATGPFSMNSGYGNPGSVGTWNGQPSDVQLGVGVISDDTEFGLNGGNFNIMNGF